MQTRVKSPMYPQQNTTLGQFVANATNILVIKMVLDLFFTPCCLTPTLMVSTASSHYRLPIDLNCTQKP